MKILKKFIYQETLMASHHKKNPKQKKKKNPREETLISWVNMLSYFES